MVAVFFSYSHQDRILRDELEVHLSGLKRQGLIDTWHDRRICAGEEIDAAISEHLEKAQIILLLVSSDFIASDYCYSVEMNRALDRHRDGEAVVIPVILRPCDWTDLPFGRLLATPTDGKPVTKYANQDEAFLDITRAIKKAIQRFGISTGPTAVATQVSRKAPKKGLVLPDVRSSNLRIKRIFSQLDRDQFITESFEFVANLFEGSLEEIKARNPELETNFRRIDADTFSAAIYRNGLKITSCRVRLGGMWKQRGIMYSVNDSEEGSGYNEMLTVTEDGYSLLLAPQLGFLQLGQGQTSNLTQRGGGEYLWGILIDPLQR